jgi:hypothetical protein
VTKHENIRCKSVIAPLHFLHTIRTNDDDGNSIPKTAIPSFTEFDLGARREGSVITGGSGLGGHGTNPEQNELTYASRELFPVLA